SLSGRRVVRRAFHCPDRMKITQVRSFILHVPVTRGDIADSMHQLTHWGAPGVLIETDAGLTGCGYTGTHAHLPTDRLVADCVEAVRRAIGPSIALMVDANGRFDLPEAVQFGRRLAEFDVRWFEEPIWYDDLKGHARLAAAISTPIALGEQLYTIEDFARFIEA